ncbi:MAG: HTH domain-containing protein [Chloroflexi bacterium]|nr:HTH domain-containing protein [Chloroflexota bacterium]MCY3696301.1 HTH domain-containing protein [Chloroflexota bacterium]MXX32984.1 HTH domain-containing protein [Chloroflexota bacterium]MXX79983.1 HTH domain-containing protein [Chloroflexota bacterium]MYB23343.1 HTH domain-containing protein [Chloroflexota bacterium]
MRPRETRTTLLERIVELGGATVAQLSRELEVSDATVRRHLERLEAEGLLQIEAVRRGPGRPSYLYRATDDGVRTVRDHTSELAERLLTEMARLQVEQSSISEALADQVAAAHRAEVPVGSLEQRVNAVVDALRPEGILDHWQRTERELKLVNNACPYIGAATTSSCVCDADRLAIEKLLGVEVEQTERLAKGDDGCVYIVPLEPISLDAQFKQAV